MSNKIKWIIGGYLIFATIWMIWVVKIVATHRHVEQERIVVVDIPRIVKSRLATSLDTLDEKSSKELTEKIIRILIKQLREMSKSEGISIFNKYAVYSDHPDITDYFLEGRE